MAAANAPSFVDLDGKRIEYLRYGGKPNAPTLVFLHEGLGSVAMWRDFPQRVADATGNAALVYSRVGYGKSSALTTVRRPDYMHVEALTMLPALLDRFAIERRSAPRPGNRLCRPNCRWHPGKRNIGYGHCHL
jgi:pimeloyl-ACP methyl ester carboxylesterase